MALKDQLIAQPKAPAAKSWLQLMEEQLDAEDYEYLLACLKDARNFSAHALARQLTKLGYPVSNSTISKIRKNL